VRARWLVVAILAVALALRVGLVERDSYKPINDAKSYLQLASQIGHTGDYSGNDVGAGNTRGPTAYFPPAYPYFLALFGGSVHAARVAQAVLGTIVVGLVGLVALELFGGAIGVIAMAAAAVYPAFIELSSVLVADTLLTAFVLAAVWAALRARRSGTPYRWCALAGLLSGLAALTHDNGFLVVIPLLFAVWGLGGGRRVLAPAALVVAAVLTVIPWIVRDQIVMHTFVPISDESGITLAGTYNEVSAHDPQIPYKWRYYAQIPADRRLFREAPQLTEPALASKLESRAFSYIGAHPLAPVSVAFHNTLRLLELEGTFPWKASAASIGLGTSTAAVGVVGFWLVLLLAIGGVFTRAARAAPWWLWAIPVLLWLSVAFVNAETPRFREPIDPFLILLAGCALEALGRRAVPTLRGAPVGRRLEPAAPAGGAQLVEMVERPA
jgi:4-amino-4-deoxy-L-arabinose transferase-like glycosyltransferase